MPTKTAKKAAKKAAAKEPKAPSTKKAAAKKAEVVELIEKAPAPVAKKAAKKAAAKTATAKKAKAAEVLEQPEAPAPIAAPAEPVVTPVAPAPVAAAPAEPAAAVSDQKIAELHAMIAQLQAQAAAAQAAVAAVTAPIPAPAPAAAAEPAPQPEAPQPEAPRGRGGRDGRKDRRGGREPRESAPAPAASDAPKPDAAPAEGAAAEATEGGDAAGGRLSRRERWRQKRMKEKEDRRKRREAREAGGAPTEGGEGGDEASADGSRGERPAPAPLGPPEPCEGILELTPKGYGFLRTKDKQWAPLNTDCWISGDLIRKYGLREGVSIKGEQRAGPRGPQLTEITEVCGLEPEAIRELPLFEELKAVNPNKRYQLEGVKDRLTTRVIDMMTPVGRGQRGLIVAPPRAGKTTLLQHIAEAMTVNHPQVHLMILLVDERPEEVTEFRRVLPNAEIFASNNDQDLKSHVRISQFAIERAKRLVEAGQHVFLLMDSITRLARAFNNSHKGGATGSGGLAVGAMEIPRRLFAAARNTRTAGSLTILATALVETGSKMDDIIFLEFKGTGNMELVLDRKIAEQYIYPAVNIFRSGTRREELLLPPFQLEKIHILRRGLAGHKPIEAVQRVISLSERYPNNAQMLTELPSK
jgi:transcription termination factor Rho